MRELIPLGRSIAANPKDFARPGELQAGRSVVGGRRDGRIVRGRSFGSTMPVGAAGSRDSIPPSAGDASYQRGHQMHTGIVERAIRVNSIWICFEEASPGCKTERQAKDQ